MPKRSNPKQDSSHLLHKDLISTLKQADESFSQGLYNEALASYLEILTLKKNTPYIPSNEIISILYQIGHTYKMLSKFTQAFGFFEQALAMIKPDSKQIPPNYILLLNSMGECQLHLAKYKEAQDIFEKCMTLLKKHKIKTGSDLAKVHRNLALLNREQGQFKKAITLINSSIRIYAQDKDTNQLDFAIAFLTRGDIYLDLTKLSKASLDIEQTFRILKENYSIDHPLNAAVWNSQSVVYSLQGKYKEAAESFDKAIIISRKSHGDMSLEIARANRMLGLNKIDHGELDQAFEVTNKAFQIYTDILGADHPATIITLSHLGNVYRLKAQYEKADKIFKETLEAKIKKLGSSHPEVATSYRLLGRLEEDQGRFQEALQHYKTSLVICEAVFQGNQYDLAASHSDVGAVYQSLGNFDEGLEHYEKALDMTIKLFGKNHPDVAVEYSNIGLVYGEVDETASEIKYYKKALNIQKEIFGEDGNELVVTYHNLGVAFGKIGQYAKALENHRKAMNIGLRIYGPNHPSVAISHYAIGVVYEKKKDYAKAMQYNLRSLKIRRDFLGNRHPDVAASCRSMGLIYGGIKDKMLQNKFLLKAYHTKRLVFGKEHDDTVDVHEDIQTIEKDTILMDRNYE